MIYYILIFIKILQKQIKIITRDEFGYKIFLKICKLYPEIENFVNKSNIDEKTYSQGFSKGYLYNNKNNLKYSNNIIAQSFQATNKVLYKKTMNYENKNMK